MTPGGTGDAWQDRVLAGLLLVAASFVGLGAVLAIGLLGPVGSGPTATVAAAAPLAVPAAAVPAPVSMVVPAIDLDVPLQRLALDRGGEVRPPTRPADAGWVEVSSRPGRPGPAVVAGHLDSRSGPAVFARLGELRPGDRVEVRLDDGSDVVYVVRGSARYAKADFPSDAVYGASPLPVLRLVTCGGDVDPATGRYRDNVVVYADLQA